ncbi:NPD-domain-containing protein [Marasmius fiardii PR-910]|nr:NPD-domain-containing protein [Marasmius fiardii PR-910]
MAAAAGGALAAQARLAGAFGFIPAGYKSPEWLQSEINLARSLLPSSDVLPLGIGYFGWELDKLESKEGSAPQSLKTALSNSVQAIWFSFGNNLGKWVNFVRNQSPKTLIFILANTVEESRTAIEEWKADVLVCQGNESGGHGLSTSPPLSAFIPSVLSFSSSTPIVAAGGLATGSHIASMLTLGASGTVLGTRFLLTSESFYSPAQRQVLLNSDSSAAVRTMAFDVARRTLEFPAGVDGRGIRNDTVEDFDKGVDPAVLNKLYTAASAAGDTSRIVVWSGTGIGLMNSVKPAAELIQELHTECVERLRAGSELLSQ